MPAWTLYRPTEPVGPGFAKILLAAEHCGIELTVKQAEGLEKLPQPGRDLLAAPGGRFPILEMPQGQLFGSQTICRFLAKTRPQLGLCGETFQEQGEVDSWLEFLQNELEVGLDGLALELQRPTAEQRTEVLEEAKRDIVSAMTVVNSHLLQNTFMVGHHPTLADFCLQAGMKHVMKVMDTLLPKEKFPCLHRWFATVEAQSSALHAK